MQIKGCIGIAIAVGILTFASSPLFAQTSNVTLTGLGTATIDGIISPGEWDNAGTSTYQVAIPGGQTVPASFRVMNDRENLYISVSFDYSTNGVINVGGDGLIINFDNENDDLFADGDDGMLVTPSIFRDQHKSGNDVLSDTDFGGTNDGEAAFNNSGGITTYEVRRPLDSADNDHDFSLTFGDVLGFISLVRIIEFGAPPPFDTTFPPGNAFDADASDHGSIIIASPTIQVTIDIKPGSATNTINTLGGVVPVAILSTNDFDAREVNPDTIFLSGAPVRLAGQSGSHLCQERDVNGDALMDLVCDVESVGFDLDEGTTVAVLSAKTFSELKIEGSDIIQVVAD